MFIPCEHKDEIIAKLTAAGVVKSDLPTADVVRIENGRPRYGVDILETSLPQETQQMHAVHFAKGCYLGQEIVERVRSRGHVNKLLVPIEIDASVAPAAGARIDADGKEVGAITSAAFSPAKNKVVALGIVRADALKSPLSIGGAAAATV